MEFIVLKQEIIVGTEKDIERLNVFAGFMKAKILSDISCTPSVNRSETNYTISSKVLYRNLQHWQRPISTQKVNKIKQNGKQQTKKWGKQIKTIKI